MPDPVAEMRRIYDAVSQTLGYRTLQQFSGGDVWQLKVMLQALGLYAANEPPTRLARAQARTTYTPMLITAVDDFRASEKLGGARWFAVRAGRSGDGRAPLGRARERGKSARRSRADSRRHTSPPLAGGPVVRWSGGPVVR